MECVFCEGIKDEQIIASTDSFKIVYDINPVQKGHILIISKEHYENIREISQSVLLELIMLEQRLTEIIEKNFDVLGVTVIQNNGLIMDEGTHFHVHLIPRYRDDCFWDNQVVERHELSLEKLSRCIAELDCGVMS